MHLSAVFSHLVPVVLVMKFLISIIINYINMDVTVRPITKEDSVNLDKFYISVLEDELKNIVPNGDIEILLGEYKKERWLDYWFENNDGKAFVAFSSENKIIGFVTSKYFNGDDSIIISINILEDEFKYELRNIFLTKIYLEYPNIKDIFIEIYEKKVEEIEFFISCGFKIWETSTSPVGNAVLNVHLMQKYKDEKK
jgi:hypothetical protein